MEKERNGGKIFGTALLLVVAFAIGIFFGRNISEKQAANFLNFPTKTGRADLTTFWNVWDTTRRNYVDAEKLDEKELVYGAIKGMINSIDDMGTVYLDPEETKEFDASAEGKYFEGIGAELGYVNGQVVVVAPIEGSPAKEAGIRPGDLILKVDDYTLSSNDSVYDAVAKIRGEAGTSVKLNILHKGDKNPVDITITRSEITVPSMTLDFIGDKKDIAHLKVSRFTEATLLNWQNKWHNSVLEINARNVDKVIIDLRSNPGGFFDAAVFAADDVLDEGYIISQQQDAKGNIVEFKSEKGGELLGKKIVVLIDNGSASASEILSGALQQTEDIKIIGSKTFGKGTAQKIFEFPDGSTLHLTTIKWLLPNGKQIDKDNPIIPDIEVAYTNADFEKGIDPQLDRAIEEVSK
ncbi:S41 family peptidase [Candidatus Dojkabacteria bacterium]|nr:S41 family peptidase [Candidatus Dojkabacteria bacterium]